MFYTPIWLQELERKNFERLRAEALPDVIFGKALMCEPKAHRGPFFKVQTMSGQGVEEYWECCIACGLGMKKTLYKVNPAHAPVVTDEQQQSPYLPEARSALTHSWWARASASFAQLWWRR